MEDDLKKAHCLCLCLTALKVQLSERIGLEIQILASAGAAGALEVEEKALEGSPCSRYSLVLSDAAGKHCFGLVLLVLAVLLTDEQMVWHSQEQKVLCGAVVESCYMAAEAVAVVDGVTARWKFDCVHK